MFLTAALLAATMASASALTNPVTITVWELEASGNPNSCMAAGMPEQTLMVEAGVCSPVDGQPFYVMSGDCATPDGVWTASLYTDSICNTTAPFTFGGATACDCSTATALGSYLAVRASCGSTMNDCYSQMTYSESDMCMDANATTSGISGVCNAGTKTTCNGGTSSSSWTWASYTDASCSGEPTMTLSEGACGECATIEDSNTNPANDFYATDGISAMINCGGTSFETDCPMASKKSGAAAKFSGAVALSAAAAAVTAMLL
jgi:hypothetical protein